MDMIPLPVQARDTSKTPKQLRKLGQVPCVVYGSGIEGSTTLQCDHKTLYKAFTRAGESTLVELDLGSQKIPALFKSIDFHPVRDSALHADFYAVNMTEEIETPVPIHFEGEAPAVKDLGGIFVVTQDEVTVKCLPGNLPHVLNVDIGTLAEFHQSVHVSDVKLPHGVKVIDDPETVLATVQEPRKEEEIAPPAPVAAEGAEGAAATAEGAAPAAEGEAGGEKKENEK